MRINFKHFFIYKITNLFSIKILEARTYLQECNSNEQLTENTTKEFSTPNHPAAYNSFIACNWFYKVS